MAASIPASLKSAGIIPFATRAGQIEKVKPAVAYWCNYWIVQQIVTKGLHNSDEESKAYTAGLMDKLEAVKNEHASEEAITDDVAAKAYLEQFGLEVFSRADSAIRNNKASRQTADTFQAAYTFLELLQIWPPLDPEIAAKIKFAKYHALRIAKAIKAGEDPNATNPAPEASPTQVAPPLDPNDPEVQALGGLGSPSTTTHQPSVQEIADEHHQISPSMARASSLDRSLHPSRAPSTQVADQGPSAPPPQAPPADTSAEGYYRSADAGDVSPLAPSTHDRTNSEGGGYFPRVSQPNTASSPAIATGQTHDASQTYNSPSAPAPISPLQPSPPSTLPQAPPQYPEQFATHAPPAPPHQLGGAPNPSQHTTMPTYQASPAASYQPPQQPQPMWQSNAPTLPTRSNPQAFPPPQAPNYRTDDEAVAKAQKHARWAISALNFEDVKTAVKEFQSALETLGAR